MNFMPHFKSLEQFKTQLKKSSIFIKMTDEDSFLSNSMMIKAHHEGPNVDQQFASCVLLSDTLETSLSK